MMKISDGYWKHKGQKIYKSDGCYVSGWTESVRPFLADTLDGMRRLINKAIEDGRL